MMALTLAHEPLVSAFPGALDGMHSLDEVAAMLWDPDAPGPGTSDR